MGLWGERRASSSLSKLSAERTRGRRERRTKNEDDRQSSAQAVDALQAGEMQGRKARAIRGSEVGRRRTGRRGAGTGPCGGESGGEDGEGPRPARDEL